MPERRRSAYKLYQLIWAGLDLIYPPNCAGCGRAGTSWCEGCQEKVRIIEPPICTYCGRRLKASGLCALCRISPPHFEAIRSWGDFEGPLREALHRMKYQRDIGLGVVLARPLIRYLVEAEWRVEAVVPVPLGVARGRERG
jgi:competence protein ComFC